ncbi:MAG: hypothetical protein RIF32_18290 [Leptospirales bacterium]
MKFAGPKFGFDQPGHIPEVFKLRCGEVSRSAVNDTYSADFVAVRRMDWMASVKTNTGTVGNQWIVCEAWIIGRISDNKGPILKNRMPAKRNVAMSL